MAERQRGDRVVFERGFPAHLMGIDGTWRRNCLVEDISETGAKLTVEGSVEGLNLKEFFLLLYYYVAHSIFCIFKRIQIRQIQVRNIIG